MRTKNKIYAVFFTVCTTFLLAQSDIQSKHTLDLDGASTHIKIQPTMYGIFFEDINFAADGGLYAELIKNRSFEFDEPLTGWKQPNTKTLSPNLDSGFLIIHTDASKTNKNYARITVLNDKNYLLENEGFRGIGIHQEEKYDFSFDLENVSGNIKEMKAELIDEKGQSIAAVNISISGKGWQKYAAVFSPTRTVEKAKLQITFVGNGVVNMDMISLFPQDTWKGRKGGLRKDLVQKLYDLQPGFLRFPGGCIVEGRTLAERYQWKKTIGKVEDRENLINKWNNGFPHRLTPDYWQSFGLGFFEYFQLSEDLGAEPLPILSCGMACQFNTAELVKMEDLDPYVQDALDLIEFANGSEATPWGKLRSDMGHPKPFNLKYIGVGNEQWGPMYPERLEMFVKQIRAKYPNIKICGSAGPSASGKEFDYGWEQMRRLGVDLVDEHYYMSPDWFLKNAGRYDKCSRKGPKVFAGEYASHVRGLGDKPTVAMNNFEAALSEAAFMTGLERNADVVHLCTYAPLFAHKEAWQWRPDLIWFDNLSFVKTPNYYVQQLFGNNAGTHVLALTMNGKAVSGQQNLYATAASDATDNTLIIKIANTGIDQKKISFILDGLKAGVHTVTLTHLNSSDLNAKNSFETPDLITPKVVHSYIKDNKMDIALPPLSFTILRIAR